MSDSDHVQELRRQFDIARRKPITLSLKCGKCVFFKDKACYGKPCSALGVLAKSDPCRQFLPKMQDLQLNEKEVQTLLDTLKTLDLETLELYAGLFHAAKRLKGKGFAFGEIVYFQLFSGDYISNYFKGRVLSADKGNVIVSGKGHYTASLSPSSLLTTKQWKLKKEHLLTAGRINDPKHRVIKSKDQRIILKYDPPEIQQMPTIRKRGRPRKGTSVIGGNISISLRGDGK